MEGRRGGTSPEPGRRGPTPPQGGVGGGPKSDAAHGAPRNGWGGCAGAAGAASLDSSCKHNRNSEPVRLKRNSNCGIYTLVRRKDEDGQVRHVCLRVKCKSYSCSDCGPRKAAQLRKAIAAKAQELDLTRFLTLTLDPSKIPADADLVQYVRGEVWAKFRVYLKRKYGKVIVYIAVLEFTEAGIPHLHVLVDRYIPQKWISDSWSALGGGRIVYIERLYNVHKIAHYLAKYLTKDVILSAPAGVRRWTVSRGIKLFEKRKSTGEWVFHRLTFDFLYVLAWRDLVAEERDYDGQVRCFTTNRDPLAV